MGHTVHPVLYVKQSLRERRLGLPQYSQGGRTLFPDCPPCSRLKLELLTFHSQTCILPLSYATDLHEDHAILCIYTYGEANSFAVPTKKSKLHPVLGTFILPQGKDSGIYRRRPTKAAELPEFSGVIIISLCLFQSYFQLVDASFLIDPCHLGPEDSVLF